MLRAETSSRPTAATTAQPHSGQHPAARQRRSADPAALTKSSRPSRVQFLSHPSLTCGFWSLADAQVQAVCSQTPGRCRRQFKIGSRVIQSRELSATELSGGSTQPAASSHRDLSVSIGAGPIGIIRAYTFQHRKFRSTQEIQGRKTRAGNLRTGQQVQTPAT